jgi:hypothetical protein
MHENNGAGGLGGGDRHVPGCAVEATVSRANTSGTVKQVVPAMETTTWMPCGQVVPTQHVGEHIKRCAKCRRLAVEAAKV